MRLLALTLAACALLAAPAGAAGVPYEVTTPDRVVLRGWIHLPPGDGPFATVLEYTPYQDNNGSNHSASPGGLQYLVDAGFAVARVSVRGTGRSGGCLRFGDRVDAADAKLVVEDLARQPWSTGKIGMTGHSYPAWTSDMGAAVAPEPLKAVVPTSGVIDLWSLLTRRGAPLAAGTGIAFAPAWTAQTSAVNQGAPEHLRCPNLLPDWVGNAETATTGDRTAWFRDRDLREQLTGTRVAMLRSNGIVEVGEGHIQQVEGLWDRLRPDRTRFVLGQWGHSPPTAAYGTAKWRGMVVAWFDHYLRGGPKAVKTGVVEYQDTGGGWHEADRWPPRARRATVRLSGSGVVHDGGEVAPATQTFQSADLDPGLFPAAGTPHYAVTACGPYQALYVSEPAAEDALVAGNFRAEVTLSSTQPGGNFAVALWKTSGPGTCPDDRATVMGRAHMDLRHWAVSGLSHDFPVATPTSFSLESNPMAATLRKGERLVVAIGGGAVELTPDPLHPVLTVHAGSVHLPVVEGTLRLGG
jgi:uncharacterized protein